VDGKVVGEVVGTCVTGRAVIGGLVLGGLVGRGVGFHFHLQNRSL